MKKILIALTVLIGLSVTAPAFAQDVPLIHGSRFALGVRGGQAFWDSPSSGWPLVSDRNEFFLGVTTSYNLVPGFDVILSSDYHFESELFRTYVGLSLLVIDGQKLFWHPGLSSRNPH